MAILSFRKLISSIFIFLSVAGILYCTFGLFGNNENTLNSIYKVITFALILSGSYYMGYIYTPSSSLEINSATCNAIRDDKESSRKGRMGSNKRISVYDSEKPDNTEDQVFNIKSNIFRYDQADKACKAFNSKVATVSQLKDAYRKGANWCNYGWTQGGFALYPIQKDYFDTLQKTDGCQYTCGSKPGIVGGRMDAKFTFGVNCYGKPPPKTKVKPFVHQCLKSDPSGASTVDDKILEILKSDKVFVNTFN